jgi:hypothetical protein
MSIETLAGFNDDDLDQGKASPILGPDYFAARRISEAVMAKFEAEHLKPLVEKTADEFREKLWDDLKDYIIGDTEMNVQNAIWRMVKDTVQALLTGEEWAMNRYPYEGYSDGEKVRKAIAAHSGDEIARRRIADLEKEVERLKESLRTARSHY